MILLTAGSSHSNIELNLTMRLFIKRNLFN